MNQLRREKVEFWLKIISTAVGVILLVGVFLAYLTLKNDHEQKRRAYTMHLYDQWRQVLDFGEARRTLEIIREHHLESEHLVQIARGNSFTAGERIYSVDEALRMRQHIVSILNLFEQIAVARRDHVGDADMIDRYFKSMVIRNRQRLGPFVQSWIERGRGGWTPLDDVITNVWKGELPSEEELRP